LLSPPYNFRRVSGFNLPQAEGRLIGTEASLATPQQELNIRQETIMGNASEFTEANFEQEVLQSNEPVLVDFWAPWCGPCRMIGPVIEELASEYSGSVKVGKVNIDDNPGPAQTYNVMNIPTLLLFHKGEVVDRFVGVQPKSKLQQALDAAKA
jgi:thioredoxin 1